MVRLPEQQLIHYVFGIDLGGTSAKIGLFSNDGALLGKWEVPTDTRDSGRRILPNLCASLHRVMNERHILTDDVTGIGLGVPGAVLSEQIVVPCVNLNGWGGFNVAEEFSRLCGLPVKIANDANAAALGEIWQGGAKGAQNMVFITLGTGVGGCVVVNGRVIEGAHGVGGEVGHIKIHPEEKHICACGKQGCLEQYASAKGLTYMAGQVLISTNEPSALRQYKKITAKDIFDCAQQGDPLAKKLTDRVADDLGLALSNISCICDPDMIVLGGGVSSAGAFLLDAVREAFLRYSFPVAGGTVFRLATLGNEAGMYGSAWLLLC